MSAQRNKEGVCSVAFATFEGAETCLPVGSFKIILWPFFFHPRSFPFGLSWYSKDSGVEVFSRFFYLNLNTLISDWFIFNSTCFLLAVVSTCTR